MPLLLVLQATVILLGAWLILGFVCAFPYIEYRKGEGDDSPFLDNGPIMLPFAKFKMLLDVDMYQPRLLQIGLWSYRALTAMGLIAVLMVCAHQIKAAS